MEHNSLAGIASARPVIYAEGLFAPCVLENGKFIPEEGLSQQDLWSVLNGELFKSGSDLVEDFTLKSKLEKLKKCGENSTYELEGFARNNVCPPPNSNVTDDPVSVEKDREEIRKAGIPMVRINSKGDGVKIPGTLDDKMKDFFEKQITWLLEDEEGEDFVVMETCPRFNDALVLLDLLKQHNIPCVLSFLARRDEPVAISFSKIHIGLDCLMFCLFQA